MKNMQLSLMPSPFDGTQLCIDVDSDIFFPDEYTDSSVAKAKEICGSCWMQEACLQYALVHKESAGVWGGTTPKERKLIRRRATR